MYTFVFIFTFCVSLAEFTAVTADEDESSREALRCRYDIFKPWSYGKDKYNGPKYWGQAFPQCNGLRQSPINIETDNISDDEHPHYAVFIYSAPLEDPVYINDGFKLSVFPGDNQPRYIYINYTRYDFESADFHFGCSKCCGNGGSEHTIDGESYAMEMHLKHKSEDNKTLIAAILFKESCTDTNGELGHVTNAAKKIMYIDTYVRSEQRLDLRNLVPSVVATYYHYEGSFTAPDCEESVTWAVVEIPLVVGCDQMDTLRRMYSSYQLYTEAGCKICGNIRRVQPLNGRKVFKSWVAW